MNVGDYTVRRWQVVCVAALGVCVIIVWSLFSTFDGVNRAGVNWETRLNAQYQDNQNALSAYVSGFYEQAGLAKVKSAKMDTILTDAAKGRYEGHTSAQPGQGQLFSAIVEANPDLKGLDIYDKIVDYVQAGRQSYKNQQSQLLDMLRGYQVWRRGGLIHRALVSAGGFPSSELRASLGAGHVLHGQAALDQMYVIVLTSDTQRAFESGTLDPLQVPDEGK